MAPKVEQQLYSQCVVMDELQNLCQQSFCLLVQAGGVNSEQVAV